MSEAEKKEEAFHFNFSNVLAITLPVIAILSITKLYFYYSWFNLDIIPFLTIGELPLILLTDYEIYLFILTVLLMLLAYKAIEERSIIGFVLVPLAMGFIIMCMNAIVYGNQEKWLLILYFFSFLGTLVTFFVLNKKQPVKRWTIFIAVCLLLTVLTFTKGYVEYLENRTGKKYMGTEIMIGDSSRIVSSDSIYYIGKTENYIFLHHHDKNLTKAIPLSQVTELNIARQKIKPTGSVRPTRRDE